MKNSMFAPSDTVGDEAEEEEIKQLTELFLQSEEQAMSSYDIFMKTLFSSCMEQLSQIENHLLYDALARSIKKMFENHKKIFHSIMPNAEELLESTSQLRDTLALLKKEIQRIVTDFDCKNKEKDIISMALEQLEPANSLADDLDSFANDSNNRLGF